MEELLISLQKENASLKEKNDKLYRKNKNQQRSMLRLKEIIEKQNGFLKKVKEQNIEDQDWEDLDIIVKQYEGSE